MILLSILPATSQAGILPFVGKRIYAPIVLGASDDGLWGRLLNVPAGVAHDIMLEDMDSPYDEATGLYTWRLFAITWAPPGSTTATWYQCCLDVGHTYRIRVLKKPWCSIVTRWYRGGRQRAPDIMCGWWAMAEGDEP